MYGISDFRSSTFKAVLPAHGSLQARNDRTTYNNDTSYSVNVTMPLNLGPVSPKAPSTVVVKLLGLLCGILCTDCIWTLTAPLRSGRRSGS